MQNLDPNYERMEELVRCMREDLLLLRDTVTKQYEEMEKVYDELPALLNHDEKAEAVIERFYNVYHKMKPYVLLHLGEYGCDPHQFEVHMKMREAVLKLAKEYIEFYEKDSEQ